MTNHIQTAIKSLTKQAEKLQERVTFYAEKQKEADELRSHYEQQLEFITGQIKTLKNQPEESVGVKEPHNHAVITEHELAGK